MIKIVSSLMILILISLCAGLSSVNSDILMNGTQSGKSIAFLWVTGIISALAIIRFWLCTGVKRNNLTNIDLLLFAFALYLFFRNNWLEIKHSLLFLEFTGLVILYFIIRQQSNQVILWILLALAVGGLVQAIYGNLQLWGYFPSHHGIFKMTGSFFNPGPYAGYLAAVFPIVLGLYFQKLKFEKFNYLIVRIFDRRKPLPVPLNLQTAKPSTLSNHPSSEAPPSSNILTIINNKYLIQGFSLATIICIFLVLPASRSRAAWLAVLVSSVYLLSVKYQLYSTVRFYINTRLKRLSLISFLVILLSITASGLYFFKQGSADGRMLIWKVSAGMIKDKPLFGYGYDGFKSHYMDYQAEYFKNHPAAKEALVAGDTNYTFNEPLQLTIEHGVIGIILITPIILLVFFGKSDFPPSKNEKYKIEIENIGLTFYPDIKHAEEKKSDWFLLHISRAVILSIVVFGLFSYPLQILPIKICLTVALAMAANSLNRNVQIFLPGGLYFPNLFRLFLKSIISVGLLSFIAVTFQHIQQVKNAYLHWKSAFDLYNYGIYADCLTDYEKAYSLLKPNGDFLTNYGKAFSMAEKHAEAVEVLQQAANYYPNTIVYTTLGDSYKKLNKIGQAEHAYLHACHMNPSRFYPKYLLAKLYNETGQKENAINIANELLGREVKIESIAIKEIKDEMKKLLIK